MDTNKKMYAMILLLISSICAYAQDLRFDLQHYSWGNTIPSFEPGGDDKKAATIVVFLNKTTEYSWDKKKENIERYYVSHTLKYINDDKSIEDNNKIYVSVYDEQNLLFIKTRVIHNGKVVFEASRKDFIEIEVEERKYNQIALKELTRGCLVETIIGYKLEPNLYSEDYFQMGYPVKSAEFLLITPEVLKFNCKVYNHDAAVTDTVFEERRFCHVKFKDLKAEDEKEAYSLTNANKARVEYVYARHMVSNYKYQKWPEMGRLFFDRMNAGYEKNAKDLDKILKQIGVKQYSTDKEKIFAIENFIKQNISSESNAPSVETFAEVLKMKYTFPFKLNQILFQLYRKAGINCEIVLTCNKENKRFDKDFDTWMYLENVIFYFPDINQFIDPQASLFRLGKINTDYMGQYGLFIKAITIGDVTSASASVRFIPANNPEFTKDYENYTVSFDRDLSNTEIKYNRRMYGFADLGYRGIYYVVDDDKKKEMMEAFVKGIATKSDVKNLEVSNFNITDYKNLETPFTVSADITTNHYIESAGEEKILLKVGELIGQQMEMYQATPRTNPVDIPYAHSYNRTITVNIPDGYKVKGLDKLNINHSYTNASDKASFGFISSYKVENNKLVIICSEYYNDLTYPVSQFEHFKEVINDAADFNKISILIERGN